MRRFRSYMSIATLTRYRELWLRFMDLFPTVMLDLEQGHEQQIVAYESYRYKAVVDGDGYMVWVIPSSPTFWEKAILPILAEYKEERVTWSKHRYNPRAFLVKLPMSVNGVDCFRDWVKTGSTDTTSFNNDPLRDDHDVYATVDDDWWDYDGIYDDDLDNMEELCKHVEEKFEKKARRK